MTLLQHHVLALSLTAFTTFGLGLLVFLADPKSRLNRIFALYSLAIVGWGIEEALIVGASTQAIANLISYIGWIPVFFIAPTFFHTVLLLVDEKNKTSRVILSVGYLVSFVFLALHLFFPGFLTELPRPVGYVRFHHDITPLGVTIPIVFLILVNLGFWPLWRAHQRATGQLRVQLNYLFRASLLAYLGGSSSWFFVFGFHLPFISPFGIYCVPLYSIATTYAVLHHKLFDVHLVIRRSVVYSLLVTSLTVGYFGLVYVVELLFRTTFGYQSIWLSLAAFALMALLFQPLKVGIQRLVDWCLFRAPHEELIRRMERLEHEVRQADKLKAISTLAAGMAHEIKNPLTSLKTFAAYLSEKSDDPAFQQKFQRVVAQEVDKIDQIVRRVLEFAKPASPQLKPVRVSQLLDETLDFLSNEAVRRRVEVRRSYASGDAIQADPQQLRQVFLNLFLNSFEAMNGSGGRVSVSTAKDGGRLAVVIEDSGHGIPKEHLQRVFDPFFTTKQDGTGLGLSIVQGIIAEHRGTISFDSEPNRGTTCTLTFPITSPEANS
jgi:signal transduction histidine kinase